MEFSSVISFFTNFRIVKKKKRVTLHFENESVENESYHIYNVVTQAHCELWVAWESFASV